MKVKILRGFCLGGGRDVYPGDIVDLDEAHMKRYSASGRVEPLPPEVPSQSIPQTESETKTARKK